MLHVARHGGGEAQILVAGSDVDAVTGALGVQLGPQRLPDAMRDDGVVERVGELRRRQRRRRPVGRLLGLVELLAEHHGGERGEADTATALVVLLAPPLPADASRGRRRTAGRCRRGRGRFPPDATSSPRSGRCERRRDGHGGNRPVQPARAPRRGGRRSAGRRSPRPRTARCAAVGDRGQPGRFDVEGEKAVPREGLFELVERGGEEPVEGRAHPSQLFPSTSSKQKSLSPSPFEKICTRKVVMEVVLGRACTDHPYSARAIGVTEGTFRVQLLGVLPWVCP